MYITIKILQSIGLLSLFTINVLSAQPPQEKSSNEKIILKSVRHDKSRPLPELIEMAKNSIRNDADLKAPGYVYPNVTQVPKGVYAADTDETKLLKSDNKYAKGSNPAPTLDLSFNGLSQADTNGGLPPDTNGDVGLQYYVQYINTDWAVYSKTDGTRLSGVNQGNTFWAGFGGVCQSHNAGDPIVLFDKTAQVWVFSQFTNLHGSPAGGTQCFAVSDRADLMDPAVTFNRYQFDFPERFNDYPHIGIWTDEGGNSSGYYFTTHDFNNTLTAFRGSSFSVVERDKMIAGEEAQFVRFPNVIGFGSTVFGALPAHLESEVLPQGNTCAPFVNVRANLNSYLVWLLCVDWDTVDNSYLTPAQRVFANAAFSNNIDSIDQPDPAPAGSELDAFANNTMYRVSARAYPAETGLPTEIIVNHSVNVGNGRSGIRWIDMTLDINGQYDLIHTGGFEVAAAAEPFFDAKIIDEGVLSSGIDNRWMGTISQDQSGNLGLAYSVSGDLTFPSVHYTGRLRNDAKGNMQDEQVCIAGGGVQTFVDAQGGVGRWGDYASMSVDPIDQCTFWTTVEYKAATGQFNWENRICSFKHPTCGQPGLVLRTESATHYDICTQDTTSVALDLNVFAIGSPLSISANVSTPTLPGGVTSTISLENMASLPSSTSITLENLDLAGTNEFEIQIQASSLVPPSTQYLGVSMSVANSIPAATTLTTPINGSADLGLVVDFEWANVADAVSYTIEISTVNDFSSIIETGSSDGTTYTSSTLFEAGTQYYWRITGINSCGDSAVSQVFDFTTGVPGQCPAGTNSNIVFTDDLEGDISAWMMPDTPVNGGTDNTNTWASTGVRVNSGVVSFLAVNSPTPSDQPLITPAIVLPAADQTPITLSFWNFQAMEARSGVGATACYDGGILEISTDGGASFTQIAGDKMLTDLYNGNIPGNTQSPLPDAEAWCATNNVPASGAQEDTPIVDISDYAGQTVQFRFRMGTDGTIGDEGWYIDDIQVQSCITP